MSGASLSPPGWNGPSSPESLPAQIPDGARVKKEGPLTPLISHVTGYAPVRLPPCLSLGTDGNLSVVAVPLAVFLNTEMSVLSVHQVAAEVGDIEPDGRT